uniref:(northern house mosquito) hypothetical protein n=1 Tax=Culex pipiens TaxID=7175 RepID=A0A8D8FG36_CULPI
MDEVDESSSPATSSCGLDAVGVDDGEITIDDGRLIPALDVAKFLNMARIESALDTFGRARWRWPGWPWPSPRLRSPKSCKASSELDSESLPWFEEVLCGERISFVLGDGGTEFARCGTSVGRLKALECFVPFWYKE